MQLLTTHVVWQQLTHPHVNVVKHSTESGISLHHHVLHNYTPIRFPVTAPAVSYYFAPGRVRSIAISVSVGLYVCVSAHMSQKPHVETSRNFLYMLLVASSGRGSVLLRRQCNAMYFRFMDDVVFSYNRACGVYCDAYGRGMSVSGRQRKERRSFSASAPTLCAFAASP